jgi:hypothetical protein
MPSNLGKSIWRRSFGQAAIISPIETPEREVRRRRELVSYMEVRREEKWDTRAK